MTEILFFCHNLQFQSALLVMYYNQNSNVKTSASLSPQKVDRSLRGWTLTFLRAEESPSGECDKLVKNRKQSFFVISVLMASVLVLGFSFFFSSTSESFVASSNLPQAIEVLEDREWIPELPVRLVIPAIDVDAEVQYVGLDSKGSGEMEVPSNFTDVGWYKYGVRPGMRGSAVIAGHFNGKGIPEAVFYDLQTLEIGDEVIIMSAERVEDIFQVVKVETYDYNEPTTDIFVSSDGKKRLNLITCGGEWLSDEKQFNKRTVVFTELLTDVE